MMHCSAIHELSSDVEGLSHADNENLDSDEQQPDEFNQGPDNDNDNDSLYNRCWQRAEQFVQHFIKEKDSATNDKLLLNESPTRATSSGRGKVDAPKSKEEKIENYQKLSSRRSQQIDCHDRSDTEFSQVSQSSSDESKTYSQVYSEIFEESKAREKKAEKIRRVYNNNNNTNRTRRWVEQLDQSDMEDYTTEASDRSDMESGDNFQQSDNENDYESLIKEQLEVIAQYRNDPLGNFRNCIEEYMCEIEKARIVKEKQAVNSRQLEEKTKESLATDRSAHSNVISIKSYSQNLDLESKSSAGGSQEECVMDNDPNINSTEILHFEHCEIYHVKRSDKGNTKDLDPEKYHSSDNENFPTEEITSNRSKHLITKDCQESSRSDDCDQYEERSSEAEETADNSYLLEVKSSVEDWKPQKHNADLSESSRKKSSGSESENSKSPFNFIEVQKSLRNRMKVNKSERASNNSHKSHHFPTTSSQSSKVCNPYEDSTDSTNNYYLSSKSLTSSSSQKSSKRSRKSRSVLITPKTYEDRACSPIKIKSSRQFNKTISKQVETETDTDEDEGDKVEITESYSSSSSKVISEDKGLQYPSENELEESIKRSSSDKKNVRCLKVYDLDKALLEVPSDFKGNAIMFDNEDELLDISLSDDEMQMQAKLQEAASSDRKKDVSSRNSSYNSIPSADRSSIFSISSYEPSERFYRRTHAEDDDDDDNPLEDADDSEPMTYKKHVSRLAERALRACTDYYSEGIKLKPDLDQELNEKVQMLYDSEMRFNTVKRQKKQDDLLQEFNERLQRQLKSIAPKLQ